MHLALFGFGPHPWPSVERTRRFYERALASCSTLRPQAEHEPLQPPVDAVLSFFSRRCWDFEPHPPVPLVFALHGGPILDQDFLDTRLGRLESTDVLLLNCTSDIAIFRHRFQGETPRLVHLPLPVDTETFQPFDKPACREQLSLEAYDFVVGFVCRLVPQKNLHQFLRMLAELKRRLHPRRVAGVVVGNYWVDYPVLPYRTKEYPDVIGRLLRELGLKEDLFYFQAKLTDDELAACYGAMDVLVHPTSSIDENFGYVPVEAMACGVPVVGAAYGGLKDTVADGETGLLMPTWVTRGGLRMDLMRGVDAVERLLRDEPLRERMSEASVERARAVYSEEACARVLREAVRGAVEARQRGLARPLTLEPRSPRPAPSGLLPEVERPWEHYQQEVSFYASGAPPRPHEGSRVRLAAPLHEEAPGRYRLDDAAWPALYALEGRDRALALRCEQPVSVAELEREGLGDAERLAHWVREGLLLAGD